MAVDEDLNKRFREAAGADTPLVEKRMMGGICFMLNGNMLGGADRHQQTRAGRFMLRIGKHNEQQALKMPGVTSVEQGGRKMGGMIFIDADSQADAQLNDLMKLALSNVRQLPPK